LSYRITLEPSPGGTPPEIRLRRALKVLFRTFRLRASRVEELPAPGTQSPAAVDPLEPPR
jgi:hypothetical protein